MIEGLKNFCKAAGTPAKSYEPDRTIGVLHDGETYHRERVYRVNAGMEELERRAKELGLVCINQDFERESGTVVLTSIKR